MPPSPKVHDRTFAKLIGQRAFIIDLLRCHLPKAFIKDIDWQSLKLEHLEGGHVSDDLKQAMRSDTVYSAQMSDQLGFFWAHFEHQSTPDPLMALRLINDQTGVLLDYTRRKGVKKVPLMFSLVYYHGRQSPYQASMDWRDCFEGSEEAKAYACSPILIDLGQIPDEAIRHQAPKTAGAQLAFKYIEVPGFQSIRGGGTQELEKSLFRNPTDHATI